MRKYLSTITIILLALFIVGRSQQTPPCTDGQKLVWNSATANWICSDATSSGVESGAIVIKLTGTCGTGYTEATELNGKTLIGTLAANGNIGTTGGSDTLTPTGTNSAPTFTGSALATHGHAFTGSALATHTHTFTGSALATHAHELPWQIPSTTTIRQIAIATFGTGTSRAATAVSAAGTANTTSAAVALSQGVTAGTPAGSNSSDSGGTPSGSNAVTSGGTPAGTVSAPTFTGASGENRSAFVRVIFCRKT